MVGGVGTLIGTLVALIAYIAPSGSGPSDQRAFTPPISTTTNAPPTTTVRPTPSPSTSTPPAGAAPDDAEQPAEELPGRDAVVNPPAPPSGIQTIRIKPPDYNYAGPDVYTTRGSSRLTIRYGHEVLDAVGNDVRDCDIRSTVQDAAGNVVGGGSHSCLGGSIREDLTPGRYVIRSTVYGPNVGSAETTYTFEIIT